MLGNILENVSKVFDWLPKSARQWFSGFERILGKYFETVADYWFKASKGCLTLECKTMEFFDTAKAVMPPSSSLFVFQILRNFIKFPHEWIINIFHGNLIKIWFLIKINDGRLSMIETVSARMNILSPQLLRRESLPGPVLVALSRKKEKTRRKKHHDVLYTLH